MLTGSLVAVRRPRLVLLHAPVALAVLAVNVAGQPCPLTVLEDHLRRGAGMRPLPGGFLGSHVFAPLGLDVHTTAVQVALYATALGLNALGYGLLLTRRSARGRGTSPRGPRRRTHARPGAARPGGRRTA